MADAAILSLEQMVHLSLGDPEVGAVNFNVLKTLLLQMLKAMNLFNYKPDSMSDDDRRSLKEALSIPTSSSNDKRQVKFKDDTFIEKIDNAETSISASGGDVKPKRRDRSSERLALLEEKVFRFESQLNAFNQIPSNDELIEKAKEVGKTSPRNISSSTMNDSSGEKRKSSNKGPILEIWQYTQLEKRIESAENGITRLASLLQDLLSDMSDLKESHESMKKLLDALNKQQEDLKNLCDALNKEKGNWAKKSDVEDSNEKIRNLQNTLEPLQAIQERLANMEDYVTSLRERLDNLPQPTSNGQSIDLSNYVTWDKLEDALRGMRESVEKSTAAAMEAARNITRPPVVERQMQTATPTADEPRRVSSGISPSKSLADLLEQLGTLNERHEQLRAIVESLENKKLERDEFEKFKANRDLADKIASLEKALHDLQQQRNKESEIVPPPIRSISPKEPPQTIIRETIIKEVQPRQQNPVNMSEAMQDFQTALQRLREEIDKIKQLVQELIDNGKLSAQDIEALKRLLKQLEEAKADKNHINIELDKKADKRDLDNRVHKKDFHTACEELSQSVNDCLQKFHTHDDVQKQDLEKITGDVDSKLDRSELDALRDYIEKQLKKLKKLAKEQQTQQHVHMMSEDDAAGLRKQLIRFHCISCDRPIDVAPREQQPSLPAERGIRPIQSPRPYTTFELDQIRQFQKSQQYNTDFGYDVYATVRQCGGSHTMTLPFKRQVKTQPTVPEETPLTKSEVDIQGHDGHIYKGRIDAKLSVDISKKQGMVMLTRPRSATQTTRIQSGGVDGTGAGTSSSYPVDLGGGNSAPPHVGNEHGPLLIRQQQDPRQEPATADMRFN